MAAKVPVVGPAEGLAQLGNLVNSVAAKEQRVPGRNGSARL